MELIWPDFIWMTDIHMDSIRKDKTRRKLLKSIRESEAPYIFVTGDISCWDKHKKKKIPLLIHHLGMISEAAGERIVFFVLGNHDYWGTSIDEVREMLPHIHTKFPNLKWLGCQPPIMLDENTALVGHDGWYDGRNGRGYNSSGRLNDWAYIIEFIQTRGMGRNEMFKVMERLADDAAAFVKKNLLEAISLGAKQVMVLTHFPPWEESATDRGQIDPDFIAFYSSRSMGTEILEVARAHPDVEFMILCGHSHTGQTRVPAPNVTCHTGRAVYGQPALQPGLQEILSKGTGLW